MHIPSGSPTYIAYVVKGTGSYKIEQVIAWELFTKADFKPPVPITAESGPLHLGPMHHWAFASNHYRAGIKLAEILEANTAQMESVA